MAGKVACQLQIWVPDDLMRDIFYRLPVKSLMRFICVNKSCYNLIKDPYFISKHLHIFNQINNRNDNIHLLIRRPSIGGVLFSLLSFNRATNTSSLKFLDPKVQMRASQILGPCNGVYCILLYYQGPILLINPAMREYRALPNHYDHIPHFHDHTPYDYNCCRMVSSGFGIDPKTSDYKIVKIIEPCSLFRFSEKMVWLAETYTLSSNSWRRVTGPLPPLKDILPFDSIGPIFVQGAVHWLVEGGSGNGLVILAFDMADDVFRIINIDVEFHQGATPTIVKFKESLALIYNRLKCFELWVMEEYGNEGSWTKHLVIEHSQELKRPVPFCNDERSLLFEDKNGSLMYYDLKTKEVINLGYKRYWNSTEATLYEESLISLGGSEQTEAPAFLSLHIEC